MPTFVRTFEYTPGDERVVELRPAHREYVAELFERGDIRMSGPWVDGHGGQIVYAARDLAHAQELIAADPFTADPDAIRELDLREWTVLFPAE